MLKSGFILLLLLFTGLLSSYKVSAQRFVYQKLTLVKDGVSGSIGFVGVAPRIHKIAGKNAFTAGIQLGWYLSDKFLISSTICQTISKVKLTHSHRPSSSSPSEDPFSLLLLFFLLFLHIFSHFLCHRSSDRTRNWSRDHSI